MFLKYYFFLQEPYILFNSLKYYIGANYAQIQKKLVTCHVFQSKKKNCLRVLKN